MALTVLSAAEETTRELPADPLVYGAVTLVLLMALILGLLMFGKGRPHS
jgi:hypothetical protein